MLCLRKVFVPLVLILGCIVAGCQNDLVGDEGSEGAPAAKLTAKDLEPSMEARQFFKDPTCATWDESFRRAELQEYTEEMYRAGAAKVLFAGIDETDGKKLSAWFVAELPKDKATREKCFKAWNAKLKDTDYDQEKDSGQDYLDLTLD